MKQGVQALRDLRFQLGDPRQDGLRGFGGLVLIEIAGHGDLVAHLGLGPVDPRVGGVGQDLPGEIGVDILRQGHVLRVPEGGVGHRLALLQNGPAGFVLQGALHGDLVVAEGLGVEDLALAVDARLVAIDSAVPKLAVSLDDEIAADAATPGYADYAAGEGGSSVPAAGGGSTPIDPPSRGGTTTGGSEEDDDDWRRREREEKIRRVREQYGFTLGQKPVTPEEIEGKKRYEADRKRETELRNREIDFMIHGKEHARKAAAKKRKATIARKKREAAAQAAREAKAAKLEAERRERAAFKAKARELGLPLQKARWTPKHQRIWDRALRREEKAKVEAERAAKRAARQGGQAAAFATSEERQKALEEKRRIVFEKYGFTLGKKPTTLEEIEGFKRWQRDQEAEYRERHRDHITEYNREYRRRKRQEALEKAQRKWTPAQWAAWERQQEAKERGTPAWLVREVARYLAAKENLPPDDVMAWLIENDGIDFLTKGAESMGKQRLLGRKAIPMAARAVSFYCSPETAAMFSGGERGVGNGKTTISKEV